METNFAYDTWGNDLSGNFATNTQNIRQFRTGKYFDEIAGLYYNQARWYDPTIGRFISESPIAPMYEEEYVYCFNSPSNYIDLNGEEPVTIVSVGGTIVAGAATGAVEGFGEGVLTEGWDWLTKGDPFEWDKVKDCTISGAAWGACLGPVGKYAGPHIRRIPGVGKIFDSLDNIRCGKPRFDPSKHFKGGPGNWHPPDNLPAFPKAKRVPSKNSYQGGGGKRSRWEDDDYIYEWDRQHGAIELKSKKGKHIGEFNPVTGKQTKGRNSKYDDK